MARVKSEKKLQPPFIDRGEPLPKSYGTNRLVAMVRDPYHIFLYWDVDSEIRVSGLPLLIRITCITGGSSWTMTPSSDADNWYLEVASNSTYKFDLCAVKAGKLAHLASSGEATTPVSCAEESRVEVPAEVFHAEIHPLVKKYLKSKRRVPKVAARRSAKVVRQMTALKAAAKIPPKVVQSPAPSRYPGMFASGRGQ